MIRSRGLTAVVVVGLALSLTARAGEFEARYSATLTELDPKRPESVCKARACSAHPSSSMLQSREQRRGLDAALAPVSDEAFAVLDDAHWKSGSVSDYLRGNPRVRSAMRPWLECGFGLYVSEGMFYAGRDMATLEQFAPMPPPDLRAWLSFLKQERGLDDIVEDASLRLSGTSFATLCPRPKTFPLRPNHAEAARDC